jgi:iron-regulated transporter 1
VASAYSKYTQERYLFLIATGIIKDLRSAIWVALGINCSSVLVEYFTIATVFEKVPALCRTATRDTEESIELQSATDEFNPLPVRKMLLNSLQPIASRLVPLKSLPLYFRHQVFLPSISLSLLYFTVLSFSVRMITFLLAVGYTSFYVGIARTISTIFELSATWIAPRVQKQIGAVRGGIWFLSWCLANDVACWGTILVLCWQ